MSLEHLVINTLKELEVICKYKNSVRITYTNVFSHLRSRDRKLRIFSKPELNITVIRADSGSPRMNNIASRDQFKPIRIGENLVVNYKR